MECSVNAKYFENIKQSKKTLDNTTIDATQYTSQ